MKRPLFQPPFLAGVCSTGSRNKVSRSYGLNLQARRDVACAPFDCSVPDVRNRSIFRNAVNHEGTGSPMIRTTRFDLSSENSFSNVFSAEKVCSHRGLAFGQLH